MPMVSVLDCQSREGGFESQAEQTLVSEFCSTCTPSQLCCDEYFDRTLSPWKMRWWGRGLAKWPHMSRLRKWS